VFGPYLFYVTPMQSQSSTKLNLTFWLAILLVGLTTSCATTSTYSRISTGTGEPVKGATKLLEFGGPR
jgi:hypothetical protein